MKIALCLGLILGVICNLVQAQTREECDRALASQLLINELSTNHSQYEQSQNVNRSFSTINRAQQTIERLVTVNSNEYPQKRSFQLNNSSVEMLYSISISPNDLAANLQSSANFYSDNLGQGNMATTLRGYDATTSYTVLSDAYPNTDFSHTLHTLDLEFSNVARCLPNASTQNVVKVVYNPPSVLYLVCPYALGKQPVNNLLRGILHSARTACCVSCCQ